MRGREEERMLKKKYPKTPQQTPKEKPLGDFCVSFFNENMYFIFLVDHRYSLEANQMQHECSCCQEYSSQTREVTLTCQNGTSISYNYVYVEQCQCVNACTSGNSAAHGSQVENSTTYASQSKLIRRKR